MKPKKRLDPSWWIWGFILFVIVTILWLPSSIRNDQARQKMRDIAARADLKNLELGLNIFYNDQGFYPPSSPRPKLQIAGPPDMFATPDQGAHILFEALLGLDQLGYHPNHQYAIDDSGAPIDADGNRTTRNDLYIEPKPEHFGSISKACPQSDNFKSNDNPVFLDDFDRKNRMPILYYRANPNGDTLTEIYDYHDNAAITTDTTDNGRQKLHPNFDSPEKFYQYIRNPQSGDGSDDLPYNPDTLLLISAGRDHQFGTKDDITNFK